MFSNSVNRKYILRIKKPHPQFISDGPSGEASPNPSGKVQDKTKRMDQQPQCSFHMIK